MAKPIVDSSSESEHIAEEAGQWVARLDRGLNAEETEAFALWKARDKRHAQEFARIEAAWMRLDQIAMKAGDASSDRAVPSPRLVWRPVYLWAVGLGAAAAILAMVLRTGPGPVVLPKPAAATSVTQVIELPKLSRERLLPDGSMALLNADSEIAVRFTPGERRVELLRGEAHFAVTKNPTRPFVVAAKGVGVRAVGTAFDVLLASGRVDVLVTEGTVRIEGTPAAEAPSVTAGQQAVVTLDHQGPASVVVSDASRAQADEQLGWQHARLQFNRTPLADAVDAFNAHNRRQIVIQDDRLRDRHISGVVRADNVDGFLWLLGASFDVTVDRSNVNEVVVRAVK